MKMFGLTSLNVLNAAILGLNFVNKHTHRKIKTQLRASFSETNRASLSQTELVFKKEAYEKWFLFFFFSKMIWEWI